MKLFLQVFSGRLTSQVKAQIELLWNEYMLVSRITASKYSRRDKVFKIISNIQKNRF